VSRQGALLAARFSFMPNRLGYCGPEENRAILDYLSDGTGDRGLEQILSRFAGAYPYYTFIAAANGIADPFDDRVTEAYWIGNELLEGVELTDLRRHLTDRFSRRFPAKLLQSVLRHVPAGARPHHNFHVFSMPIRTGHLEIPHSLETIDQCRISWGRVSAVGEDDVIVQRRPLRIDGEALALGDPEPRPAFTRFNGKALLDGVAVGDVVAMHWGGACYKLTTAQARWLAHYTRHHLAITNAERHGAVVLGR
jgi:uncharacterized protein DUF6390